MQIRYADVHVLVCALMCPCVDAFRVGAEVRFLTTGIDVYVIFSVTSAFHTYPQYMCYNTCTHDIMLNDFISQNDLRDTF